MSIFLNLLILCALVQMPSGNPAQSGSTSDVTTFRTSRLQSSAQRARAAMAPKYSPTPLTSPSGMSSTSSIAAQSKATSLVTLNRAKRSSQYIPEDSIDKVAWQRKGIATATPWDREVGGWDKRPDWKQKSTWDGTQTKVSGGNLAGDAKSGRQTYDVKHPNLVVNGNIPVKRR